MPTDIDDLIIATLEGPSSPPSAFLSETSSPPADVPNDEVAPTQQSDATRSQGPAFFYRRRDQWIRGNYRPSKDGGALADGAAQAGVLSSERSGSLLSPAEAHAVTRQDNGPLERLGVILSMPRAIEDDDIWEDYLKSIHSKLVGGSTLKQGMSLAYAVKILHAGWLRDGTWAGTTETAQFSSTSNPTSVVRVNQTMQPFRTIPDGQPSPAYATYMPSRMSDPRPISHLPSPSSISTHHSARDKAELVESPLSA